MIILSLLLIASKIFGSFLTYSSHLPERFPPETFLAKLGYGLYLSLYKLILITNQKLPLFPSKVVPLMENSSLKIFFLKAPFVFADLLLLLIALGLFYKFIETKKHFKVFLFFSALNFWPWFYVDSQRTSFFSKLNLFFFKPYKLDRPEKQFFFTFIGGCFLVLILFFWQKLAENKTFKRLLKKSKTLISRRFLIRIVPAVALMALIHFSGIFLNFNSAESLKWKGYFVWLAGGQEQTNQYLVFKKDFNLLFSPQEAQIYLFCQSEYRLFLNDEFVGRGGLVSGSALGYFEAWPAAPYLKKGKNTIRVECHNSYLNTLSMVKKPGGMIFQLEAKKGFLKKRVVSDDRWLVALDERYQSQTEKVSNDAGFQQIFNAGDEGNVFKKAKIIDRPPVSPWEKLLLRPIPVLSLKEVFPVSIIGRGEFRENTQNSSLNLTRVIAEGFKFPGKPTANDKNLQDIQVINGQNPYLIYDFGRMVVGYPKIEVESEDSGIVDFGFAEVLLPDGIPDVGKMVSQADRIKVGKGKTVYEWFERRAFRFLIVIFRDFENEVKLNKLSLIAESYPADQTESFFQSSDPRLNQIYEVAKYTATLARQGKVEDCPHREKGQYVGDLRIVSLVNYYNFSDKRLVKKALGEFADSQESDGFVRAVYPAGNRLLIPDYSAQWVSVVWEYYLFSGDKAFLQEIYPAIKKQLEGFVGYADSRGLIYGQKDWWVFIDQGDQELNLNTSISLNLFYLEALNNAARIAQELGEIKDERDYSSLAQKLGQTIREKAWNENAGLYDDCLVGENPCRHFSRQTNTLALLNLGNDQSKSRAIVGSLLSNRKLPQIITPYFNSFVAQALFKQGYSKEALSLIKNYWGGMLERGATSFWETFDAQKGKESAAFGESRSHGWSSGPAYLLPEMVLGIQPLSPGFSRFSVSPLLGVVSEASGQIPVSLGTFVKVSFSTFPAKEITLEYNFPASAEVSLPFSGEKVLTVNGSKEELKVVEGKIKVILGQPGQYLLKLN